MSNRIGLGQTWALILLFAATAAQAQDHKSSYVEQSEAGAVSVGGEVTAYDPGLAIVSVGELQIYVGDFLATLGNAIEPGDEIFVLGMRVESTGYVWATSVERINAPGLQSITGTGVSAQSITGTGVRAQSITGTGKQSITGTGASLQSITGTGASLQSITGTGASLQSITGTGVSAQSITGTGRLSITGTGAR